MYLQKNYLVIRKLLYFLYQNFYTNLFWSQQLPTYDEMYSQFKDKGIDDVYCVSVNDAFVMNAWARDLGIKNVKMIPDGDGTFTRSMGMLVNKPKQGFGMRSWRYAAIVNNDTIENMFIEPGQNDFSDDDDPYTVSSPEHVLSKRI